MERTKKSYEDMLDLPYPFPRRRTPMAMRDRAAQFSPFAALTGYEELVAETARSVEERVELAPEERERILERLDRLHADPASLGRRVVVSYFVPDERKAGGERRKAAGRLAALDGRSRRLVLDDGTSIPVDDISAISE